MKTLTVYSYEELSDTAKAKARDWYRSGAMDDEWYDSVYEDAARVASILGIEFKQKPVKLMGGQTRYDPAIYFTGFSSQGDGACFEGTYRYAKKALKKIQDYAPGDGKLRQIAEGLQALQKAHGYKLTATVAHRDRYYHKYSVDITVGDSTDADSYADEPSGETVEALENLLRDFMDWIYRTLEAEWDYQNADEKVAETIRANDWQFYADGSRARG